MSYGGSKQAGHGYANNSRRAHSVQMGRSKKARNQDSLRRATLAKSVEQWEKDPSRFDLEGVDTPIKKEKVEGWDRLELTATKNVLFKSSTYWYHTQGMGAAGYALRHAQDWRKKNAPDGVILPYYKSKDKQYEGIAGFVVVDVSDAEKAEVEGFYVSKPSEISANMWADYQDFIFSWSAQERKEGWQNRNQQILEQYRKLAGKEPGSNLLNSAG